MGIAGENLLGETIKRARERLKLTGEDIRRHAGIHPTSLSFIERGEQPPSVEQLKRLATVLKIDAAKLAALAVRSTFVSRGSRKAARQATEN
jgi:transcriptional regulator with XRE-family HTH domain